MDGSCCFVYLNYWDRVCAALTSKGNCFHGTRSRISTELEDSGWEFSGNSEDVMEYQIPGFLPRKEQLLLLP